MIETIIGALLIMCMRIADVSLGTFRTILVVHGSRIYAAITGSLEVLIWIFAMRYIMLNLDNTINLIGYAVGFGLGNLTGITLEQKIGLGYAQINIISQKLTREIAAKLRQSDFACTLIPTEGGFGNSSVAIAIVRRKDLRGVIKLVEEVDDKCFISVQHSRPYRGYIHGSRK
ncbi:MAG: DUF5698 domain-containing protein [Ignavibacteria bacterium]|jgi:uncharacterized protein YebE (UPF0316 family)